MTATPSIDPEAFLHEQLAQASPDLMRQLLETFINALLSAQADAVCGAEYGTRSAERTNRRNGYRHRDLDTRTGTLDVAVPKLREGSFFPEWLLERRRRAEAALTTVVATCYLLGVSTRRMDKLGKTLGITGLSSAGHQYPAVTSRYLHPDTQAVLDAGTAFSAWWSGTGPEKPSLGVIQGGRSGG